MKLSTVILPGLAALLSLVVLCNSGRGQIPNDVGEIMQAKLGHAQKVLEALATEDFQTLAKHSQELSLLSQAAAWQVLQTPSYLQHSSDFRRSADAMTAAAKKQNVDAAALAYVQMTLNCINCHKYVRHVKAARLPPDVDKLDDARPRLADALPERRTLRAITTARPGNEQFSEKFWVPARKVLTPSAKN